jgi:parallel beta-helix repeat protein
MNRRAVSGTMLILVLIGMLTLAFNIQQVEASGTIYIRADGSVEPDTAPISTVDNVTYTFTDNIYDEVVVERSNITIDGNGTTLQGSGSGNGFYCSGINNVTIKNTNIKNFSYGILLDSSSNNSIAGNNITANNELGIWLYSSSNNSIAGNNATNSWHGILLDSSSNNSIVGNNITANNELGIWLYSSSNNSIVGNNITANNLYGIELHSSSNNSIAGNSITANNGNGISLYHSSNNNISGNNATNNNNGINIIGIPSSPSNNNIAGNNATANNGSGINLYSSSNDSIAGNNVANNVFGISLYSSSNESISGNTVANNMHGIGLYLSSSNNSIAGNNITANSYKGIGLYYSSLNNSIVGNTVANNNICIELHSSSNNSIYHNNFINNLQQVRDYAWDFPSETPSINTWDDGYPSGGNYWSDYEERYPGAMELDGSGIWDTPYEIDDYNQDNYPLMEPWTPTPPIPTTIDELRTETEDLGFDGEIDNKGIVKSLLAKLNVAQKLIENGKINQAKNILNAFINEVQAQSGKHITLKAADILIESAEYILSHL